MSPRPSRIAPPGRHPADREILRLAVPALGALAAEPLYILTDTAVVGHLGTPQLGGLAVARTILTTAFSLFNFLSYGTTAAVARAAGRRRMIIGSTEWMTTAHRIYERLGFRRVPELDQQWGDIRGLCFRLELTSPAEPDLTPT